MSISRNKTYVGRFAPSPTGPLHIGSMLAALGSYLQARHYNGKWLVRIEDLDPPREIPGASDDILRTLENFHLYWDDSVVYQSQRTECYRTALDELKSSQLIYPCYCSRKIIQQSANYGPLGMVYPGTCRTGNKKRFGQYSWRLILPNEPLEFHDQIKGKIAVNLQQEIGDTVLFRADGFFAYHLAVVVDDYLQNVTEVVRGEDLLYSTPVHIHLQNCLNYQKPAYVHLPIIVNKNGEKLSKQTGARKIPLEHPTLTLIRLLKMLNQQPPPELLDGNLEEILSWAATHWKVSKIPAQQIFLAEDAY